MLHTRLKSQAKRGKKADRQMTHGITVTRYEGDVREPLQRGRRRDMRSGGRSGLWEDARKAMRGQTNNGGPVWGAGKYASRKSRTHKR